MVRFVLLTLMLLDLCLLAWGMPPQSVKIAEINPNMFEQYAGNYRLAPDRFISIGPFSEVDNRPLFFDSKTRRVGVLYPLSETEFVTGTLNGNLLVPADLHVAFIRDKEHKVTGLIWHERSARPINARRVSPHWNEEVTFRNGQVTLHGTLTLPVTSGRHPVVIFLQEAGPRARPFGMWPYLFARYGIGMLTFDKRGSGASSGDWQTASFDDLAEDVLAALRLLRSRSDIDPKQIGLWGNSNSGWVLPLVAARSKDIAFVINRVGSLLPPTENVLYEMQNQLHEQGFTAQEIQKAVALRRMLQNAIVTNKGWEQFIASAQQERNERWFPMSRVGRYLAAQLPPDSLTLQQWRNPLAFDPIPYWERVTCPVLAIYGELDGNTPTKRNAPLLIEALKRAGNRDYTITVLPTTGHRFFEYGSDYSDYTSTLPSLQRYVPGYVDGMMNWLLQRVKVKRCRSKRTLPRVSSRSRVRAFKRLN